MLGMARALATLRDEWAGTLVLVSQPTRLLAGGMPSIPRVGADERRVPQADMVLALRAAPSPLGSILSVRGQRRSSSDTAEVVMSRLGAYEAPRHAERVASLAASTTRLYGLPEDAIFGYLLVGIAPRELTDSAGEESDMGASDVEELDSAVVDADLLGSDGLDPSATGGVDLAALLLGTKLATVAVLELLDQAGPARGRKPAISGRGWTLHNY
jgi:hypothetical protein